MKASLFAALFALPALAAAQAIINTPPAIVQCQPVAIQFSGGTAPYFISVLPGGQQSAAALKTFPTQDAAGSYTWTADIPAGTTITFQIRDGSGNLNYSDMVTIQSSDDSSCLSGGGAASSASPASSSVSSATSSASSSASSSVSSAASRASSTIATTSGASSTGLPTTTGTTTTGTIATTGTPSPVPSASPTGAAGKVKVATGLMAIAALAMVIVA